MERLDEARLEAWIAAARTGDRRAFESLVESLERPLFRFLVRATGDMHLASDLFQETLMHMFQALPGYASRGRPSAWIFTIASHLVTDVHRRAVPVPADLSCLPAPVSAEASPGDGESAEQAELARALAGLEPRHRAVVCLHAYGNLTFREIARIMDVPLGTVLFWMQAATGVLRRRLAPMPAARASGGGGR